LPESGKRFSAVPKTAKVVEFSYNEVCAYALFLSFSFGIMLAGSSGESPADTLRTEKEEKII
jgi:hypothetical protein